MEFSSGNFSASCVVSDYCMQEQKEGENEEFPKKATRNERLTKEENIPKHCITEKRLRNVQIRRGVAKTSAYRKGERKRKERVV